MLGEHHVALSHHNHREIRKGILEGEDRLSLETVASILLFLLPERLPGFTLPPSGELLTEQRDDSADDDAEEAEDRF